MRACGARALGSIERFIFGRGLFRRGKAAPSP
jgi:hypothetical protein